MDNKTLYVSDLDGTLLNSDVRVSAKSAEIINSLIERGMCFTYATARSLTSARAVSEGLRLCNPVIAHNGTFIMNADSSEVLHGCFFDGSEAVYIRALLTERGTRPLVYSHIEGAERVSWHIAHETEGIRGYADSRYGDRRLRPVDNDNDVYAGQQFYFLCIGSEGEFDELFDIVRRDGRYNCTLQEDIYLHNYWFEIMPKDATKAKAIKRLCAMLGCGRVVSFGDAVNDLPMFEISDEAYAVANAIPELKAAATAVIGSNDEDGVAMWLLQNYR